MRGSADDSLRRMLEAHQHHRTCSSSCKQVRKMRSTHSSRHSPSEARSAPQLNLTKFGLGGPVDTADECWLDRSLARLHASTVNLDDSAACRGARDGRMRRCFDKQDPMSQDLAMDASQHPWCAHPLCPPPQHETQPIAPWQPRRSEPKSKLKLKTKTKTKSTIKNLRRRPPQAVHRPVNLSALGIRRVFP